MKAVDFIVELEDRILFIEIKDPQHPRSREEERDKFIANFLSGQVDGDLKYKYRDSFLYEWGSGRAAKPIYYLVLVALDTLTESDLLARTDALQRQLPLHGPGGSKWKRPFVAGCTVFNIASWNRLLPKFKFRRASTQE
jgi:hypothetical protein